MANRRRTGRERLGEAAQGRLAAGAGTCAQAGGATAAALRWSPPCYRARPTATCACGARPTARPTAHALQRTVKSKSEPPPGCQIQRRLQPSRLLSLGGTAATAADEQHSSLSWYRRPAPRVLAPFKFSACQTQRPALRRQPEAGRR